MELAYDDASPPLDFGAAAVLPEAGDNCAIARAPTSISTGRRALIAARKYVGDATALMLAVDRADRS